MCTGCPRAPVHETALQLLQLLDKRFFGNINPLPTDGEHNYLYAIRCTRSQLNHSWNFFQGLIKEGVLQMFYYQQLIVDLNCTYHDNYHNFIQNLQCQCFQVIILILLILNKTLLIYFSIFFFRNYIPFSNGTTRSTTIASSIPSTMACEYRTC